MIVKTTSDDALLHRVANGWARLGSLGRAGIIAGLLGLATAALYWPVIHHDFLDFDDDQYVTANTLIQHGLAWDSLRWELLNPIGGNWHPVTMLSHAMDCQFYGLNPAGHHFTNLLLHAINTVLVFVLFRRLTGGLWRSAAVAALFAWHPLHVESVAWVAERKDVLSTCFGLMALLAYVRFARDRTGALPSSAPEVRPFYRSTAYWLTGLCLALGLLSKPMLVTWPLLLLLLDYWPLGRFRPLQLKRLLVEKIPFFALVAVMGLLTFLVQKAKGATHALAYEPLSMRFENAMISCCRYLGKMIWPVDLSIFYPYPKAWPLGGVLLAALLLATISVLAWTTRQRRPYFFVGWAWFVITLMPVIGLVQVGAQAMADRYTYIPSLGIFTGVVWGAFDWSCNARRRVIALSVAVVAVLILCGAATRRQLAYWQNSETLFRHALAVGPDNELARNNLGSCLASAGEWDAAIEQFRAALRLKPDCGEAFNNLGQMLFEKGDPEGAVVDYRKALELEPEFAMARYNLATALTRLGRSDEAIAELSETIRLQPDFFRAHNDLGILLSAGGQTNEAISQFQQALWLQPGSSDVHFNLGNLLAQGGDLNAAMSQYLEAARLSPRDAEVRRQLGSLLARSGQFDSAMREYKAAIQFDTNNAEAYYKLGNLEAKAGLKEDATSQFLQALRVRPDFAEAHNNLGSVLSAQGRLPDAIAHFREAVRLKADYVDARFNLGNALLKNGQLDEAASQYQAVINLAPNLAAGHYYLGMALSKKGQTSEAIAQFRATLELRPNDAVAHEKLGLALSSAGSADEAIEQFKEALRLKPDLAEASNHLARSLSAKGIAAPP